MDDNLEQLTKRYYNTNIEGDTLDYSKLNRKQQDFLLDTLVHTRTHTNDYFYVTRIKDSQDQIILYCDDVVLEGRDGRFADKHVLYQKVLGDNEATIQITQNTKGDLNQQYLSKYTIGEENGKNYHIVVSFYYKQK